MLDMIVIFAHWCPICNMMLPIVEEIETDYLEHVRVTWIEFDKHPEAVEQYKIEIVPTFIILRENIEVARMTGMIGENILRKRMENEII